MTAALGAEVSIDNLSLGEDMHRAGRPKPDGVRQAGPVSIDLARARLPAQLPYQLADVGNTRRADWVALGEQPAAGVDGDVAAKPGLATLCSTTANGRDGPSGMTSQGIQISSRLRVAPSRSLDVVRETLALIDTIHDDGNLPELSVRLGQARLEHGGYRYARDGRPLSLTVSRHASQPHLTVAHEIGHFLDHHGLGNAGRFASEGGRIRAVMNAIHRSEALSRLRRLQHRRQVLVVLPTGRRIVHQVQQRYVEYRLEPKELFARAYAQYLAWAGEHAALRQELLAIRGDVLRGQVYHEQWDDDDFQPVAVAIDMALRRRGWRR